MGGNFFVTVSVRKVLPCLMIGKWILTDTEVSEFVAVMWKLRLSTDVKPAVWCALSGGAERLDSACMRMYS